MGGVCNCEALPWVERNVNNTLSHPFRTRSRYRYIDKLELDTRYNVRNRKRTNKKIDRLLFTWDIQHIFAIIRPTAMSLATRFWSAKVRGRWKIKMHRQHYTTPSPTSSSSTEESQFGIGGLFVDLSFLDFGLDVNIATRTFTVPLISSESESDAHVSEADASPSPSSSGSTSVSESEVKSIVVLRRCTGSALRWGKFLEHGEGSGRRRMGSGAGEFGEGEGRQEVGECEGEVGEGGERRYPGYANFVVEVDAAVIGDDGTELLPPMTIFGQLHPPYPPYPYPLNVPPLVRLGNGGRRIGGRRRRQPWG